jgi:hypothetical protein
MKMLIQFDAELLIGQLSYKQRAEIYNMVNGCDTAKKTRKGDKDKDGEGTSAAVVVRYVAFIRKSMAITPIKLTLL